MQKKKPNPETTFQESGPGCQWNLTRKPYLWENHWHKIVNLSEKNNKIFPRASLHKKNQLLSGNSRETPQPFEAEYYLQKLFPQGSPFIQPSLLIINKLARFWTSSLTLHAARSPGVHCSRRSHAGSNQFLHDCQQEGGNIHDYIAQSDASSFLEDVLYDKVK